jgi:SAM-dependent methyltransferase
MMAGMSHVTDNREYWNGLADQYATWAHTAWAQQVPTWGIFHVGQDVAPMLPDDLTGLDVVELGCGTGYVSAWAARRGGRPVGLDNSPRQLATARAMQAEFGLSFPLLHADAERVPLRDASFDFAVSEYGASIWCDPYRWVPEAARLLRPGGRLAFLCNSVLLALCVPDVGVATDRLLRPQACLHATTWPSDGSTDFHLGHGDMLRLLRDSGFEVEDLIEVFAPAEATTRYEFVDAAWARQWPVEEVWLARRTSHGPLRQRRRAGRG